jgi:hypothetical protein
MLKSYFNYINKKAVFDVAKFREYYTGLLTARDDWRKSDEKYKDFTNIYYDSIKHNVFDIHSNYVKDPCNKDFIKFITVSLANDVHELKKYEFRGPTLSWKLTELITSCPKSEENKIITVYTDEEIKTFDMWSTSTLNYYYFNLTPIIKNKSDGKYEYHFHLPSKYYLDGMIAPNCLWKVAGPHLTLCNNFKLGEYVGGRYRFY